MYGYFTTSTDGMLEIKHSHVPLNLNLIQYLINSAELLEEGPGCGQKSGAIGTQHHIGHIPLAPIWLQQQLLPER